MRLFKNPAVQIFLLSTLIAGLVYGSTVSPRVTLMDAADLILGAQTLGVVHPPGYPLFVMLGFLFSKIFFFLDPAHQINLMNALFGALASGLLSLIAYDLWKKKSLAVFCGLCLALTSMTWRLSTATEVYTLNLLLNNAMWLLALRYRKSLDPKTFFGLCMVIGLAFTNSYPLIILSGIGLVFVIPLRRLSGPLLLKGLGFFALGLLPYLYLFIQSQRLEEIRYVFFDMSDFGKVWDFILRVQYNFLDQKSSTALQKAQVLLYLVKFFVQEYSLNVLFVLVGIYAAFKTRFELRWALIVSTLTSSLLLAILIGTTPDEGSLHLLREYLLPTLSYLAIFAALGVHWIAENFAASKTILTIACVAGLAGQAVYAYPHGNQRGNTAVEAWGNLLLSSLPQNTHLLLCGDEVFPLTYLQIIKGVRQDVTLYSSLLGPEVYLYTKGPKVRESIMKNLTLKRLLEESDRPVYATHCGKKYIPEGHNVLLKGLTYQFASSRVPEQLGMDLSGGKLEAALTAINEGPGQKHHWMGMMRKRSARMLLPYALQRGVINNEQLIALMKRFQLEDDKAFLASIAVEFAYLSDMERLLELFRKIGPDSLEEVEPDDVAVYCRVLLLKEDKEAAKKVCLIPDAALSCDADAKYNLGRAFWDDKAKSLAYLRAAVACNPRVAVIQEALRQREASP